MIFHILLIACLLQFKLKTYACKFYDRTTVQTFKKICDNQVAEKIFLSQILCPMHFTPYCAAMAV